MMMSQCTICRHTAPKSAIRAMILVIAGLSLLSVSLFAQGNGEGRTPRTISVTGTGTVHAAPDLAVVRIGVESRSADVKAALSQTADTMNAVMTAVEAAGIAKKDIVTVSYDVSFYQNQPMPGHTDARNGYYRVVDIAAITVREIGRLGEVLDRALAAGANDVQGVRFSIEDPASLESEARALAYKQAYERATELAKLSGTTVARVLTIRETGTSSPLPDSRVNAAALAAAPPVSAGQLQVTVMIQATFQIR